MTTRYTKEDNPTIFGKILRQEIPSTVVYEDDKVLAFKDIAPQAPTHILIIPKEHFTDLNATTEGDVNLLGYMMTKASEIAKQEGIAESGYRVITNIGADGGQEVPHFHLHILGGHKLGALVGE
ncbi:MAG: histidine triad nucleotide-binding protein [Alphaproteobacteria bacterium]|nr:histidine triad nucleotide-binding protein [Alphaproteobacteria bacterium]MDD9919229.1 histidine triad nucleotide-binding protein [Alphaproteobacteria bacterium]